MEHINTFENGLSSDVSLILQPDGTYRYLKNCQLLSQDGNDYTIKDCLGNTLIFTINPPYNGTVTVGISPMPIIFISFPNKLVVISTHVRDAIGGPGQIGVVKYETYGEGVQPLSVAGEYHAGYVPLYYHDDLTLSQMYRADGFSFIENELIERIYWTDNFNSPRVFNISDPIFTNYFASGSLSATAGTKYMVLEGAVRYNGVDYGPGLTNKNIITTTGGIVVYTNLTGTTPTPKVIEYYPVKLLDFTPSRLVGGITLKEYGSGNVFCGSKVYFYRLGKNTNGIVTTWSYPSYPIPVGGLNDTTALSSPTVPYHDFTGGGTKTTLLNSHLSVLINIDNVDTDYDYIELAVAEYDQLIDAPRQIVVVDRQDIAGNTSVTLTHEGSTTLSVLTVSDVTLFPASILKCKSLTTDKNFIFAGNTTERKELDIDVSAATSTTNISPVNYPMNVHYDATSCSLSGPVYSGISPTSGANPGAGTVTPFSRWLVTAGQPIYNGVTYQAGDVIVGVSGAGNSTIDFATHAGSQARPCVTKNKYTSLLTGKRVENAIELKKTSNAINDCFWDYKSAAAHHHVASYWSGETYRFAWIGLDLKGNPFYARHIADYTLPTVLAKSGLTRRDQIGNSGNYVYSLNPTLINISGITIPPDIASQLSGWMIVRAERDARIIAQGLVTQNVDTGATPKIYRPAAYNPIVSAEFGGAPAARNYSFICPDSLVGVPFKKPIGVIGDIMEEATWLEGFDYGGGSVVRGQGVAGSEQVYTKYLSCINDSLLRPPANITYYGDVSENQTLTNLGNSAHFENGSMRIGAAAGTNVKGTCVTGGLDYTLDNHYASCGKKSVFILDNDFLHYGPAAAGYTAAATNGQTQKMLMNYCKAGYSNPYGGSGQVALANTLYVSTGHYQAMDNATKLNTFDGTNYVFNNVEIGGGDCFPSLIDYGYALWDNTFVGAKYSWSWTFPCECNANYNLRRGRKTSNVEMYYTGTGLTNSIVLLGPAGEVYPEDYSYNQGYSTENQAVVYPALPANFINSGTFQARIRFAGVKFIGEIEDSFRKFAVNDYKDLSANYGRINKVAFKDDKGVVFQDDAISTIPVLERQQTTSVSGDTVNIGTGGVVDRFDVINSFFGTQHQWSVTETEYGFAFFDMRRKAFLVLDFSRGLNEVSQIFGLKSFFNEVFVEIEGSAILDADKVLNSPTLSDNSDRPLMGIGITGVFDPKFKMTYLTFKFSGQNASGYKSKDFTIGYLHTNTKKCFVGLFDWTPSIAHNHNQIVISVNNPKNTTQYLTATLTNKVFAIGDTIWGDVYMQDEYICIAPVTLDNVAKYPKGASGGTYWALVNTVNQLWVHNQPIDLAQTTAPDYLYNMFFGKVYDNEVQIVVNPKTKNPFNVLNIEQEGNNVNITDIYISADRQSASETNIKSWSRFYKVTYDSICSSLPLSSTGRITDRYLLIRMVKHNWTTSPITLTTGTKILRWLKSFYEEKR